MEPKKMIFAVILPIVAVVGVIGAYMYGTSQLENYEEFTSCLHERGVVMFGASWCTACSTQKKMFERGAKNIPYFECYPDGTRNNQDPECINRNIYSTPTWQFDEDYLSKLPDEVWAQYAVQYDSLNEESGEDLSNFEKLKALDGPTGGKFFNDGRLPGVLSFEEISLYSGCAAPSEQS